MTLGNLEPRCGENCCYAKGIAEVGNSECRVEMYEKYAGSQDPGLLYSNANVRTVSVDVKDYGATNCEWK